MYMRNHDNHNCLYFMLGATMTALGCMGYCMCKEKGYLQKLRCNHGNGRGMLKMKGKSHHGHHGHGVHEEYQGYQMEEENSNMNSNNQQSNTNSKNPENEQQKEQQVTHQEY